MKRELDCLQCGARYTGTEQSRFCPACRKERQRQWAKEHDICHGGARARWRKKGETAIALSRVEEALLWLNKRIEDRIARCVLGTMEK